MQHDERRQLVSAIVSDPTLTYHQRMRALAAAAEDMLDPPPVSAACAEAIAAGIVCDLHEGNAPHRPRYTMPDYGRALSVGSAFLELPPPSTLDEALTFLLCVYGSVPSITGYPVWLGDVDALLEPFAETVDDEELHRRIRQHWIVLDRLFPDAFTHANLGPSDSRVARTVLAVHRQLRQVVPNLTLKVDPLVTPDDLLRDAARTMVVADQPHLVNHPMMVHDLGERYGVASCYNALPVAGGAHTLVRLDLRAAARRHGGPASAFTTETLPRYVELTAELIEARIRFLVETAGFFEHSWLVREGLLSIDRFTAMFGVFGLAECVQQLLGADGVAARYGHDAVADDLAHHIVDAVAELVAGREMPYCDGTAGRCLLHSQAGLDTDTDVTPGTRIPAGDEPDLYRHVRTVAPLHVRFPAGVSDIVHLDETVSGNLDAAVDIAKGAMSVGMRDVTFDVAGNDFVRVTGYLVRRSDLEHLDDGVRHGSTVLGAGAIENSHLHRRRPQRIRSHELAPRPDR